MRIIIALVAVLLLVSGVAYADHQWSGIVIHHSASDSTTTIDDIDRWHREFGWDGCGYHYVIHWDGSIHEGRPIHKTGAHAYGRNSTHVGICLIGNDEFSPAQIESLKTLVVKLKKKFPIKNIERHHEECPGVGISSDTIKHLNQL